MIIDCHGHFTTSPASLKAWREKRRAFANDPGNGPKPRDLVISDDEIRHAVEGGRPRLDAASRKRGH